MPLCESIIVECKQQGVWRAHRLVPLPARTYWILACFLDHPHQILPESLLLHVGWPEDIRTAADLFPQIHRIRQAVELDPHHPQVLVTRREVGYLLQATSVAMEITFFPPPTECSGRFVSG